MRAAPPVDYPVSRHGLWDLPACALAGSAAALPVAWLGWQLEAARMIAAPAVWVLQAHALLFAVVAAWWTWRRRGLVEPCSLRWDGQAWHQVARGHDPIALDRPSVCLDLGSALLLKALLQGGKRVRWLALERRSEPSRWHALRVVLRRPGAEVSPSPAIDGVIR
jgi:hypothetical protein